MNAAIVLPAGRRAMACARCGGAFECGVDADPATPCFCSAIALDARRLAELRERYADCLCGGCLASLTADPERPA